MSRGSVTLESMGGNEGSFKLAELLLLDARPFGPPMDAAQLTRALGDEARKVSLAQLLGLERQEARLLLAGLTLEGPGCPADVAAKVRGQRGHDFLMPYVPPEKPAAVQRANNRGGKDPDGDGAGEEPRPATEHDLRRLARRLDAVAFRRQGPVDVDDVNAACGGAGLGVDAVAALRERYGLTRESASPLRDPPPCWNVSTIDTWGDLLERVAATPLLTPAEEVVLGWRVQYGRAARRAGQDDGLTAPIVEEGRSAEEQFVTANLRLLVNLVTQREGNGLDRMDRFQDGVFGLMRAAQKFDPGKGYKFSTYATWWIRQSVDREAAGTAEAIRFPVHVRDRIRKILKARNKLTVELQGEPSSREISHELGIDVADVEGLLQLHEHRRLASLETPVDENGALLGDFLVGEKEIGPEDLVMQADAWWRILDAMCERPALQALILLLRYGYAGEQFTLEHIGDLVELTRERVRQLQKRSLDALRTDELASLLDDYSPGYSRRCPAAAKKE